MKCPRCEKPSLDERERSGLTVDVCSSCRGVWLDRGELEKLLALAKQELEDERAFYGATSPRNYDREPPSSDRRHVPAHSQTQAHVDQRGHDAHGRPQYKKRSWLENIGDIFD